MKKENLKEMKLFLVISDDDEYEYINECLENIIIAESEERALEIAEENGYEDVSVRLITDSLNKEFCSRDLRDYVYLEDEVKTNIGLADSIDEELINKSREDFLKCMNAWSDASVSMKKWVDTSKLMSEVLEDLKDAWTEFENLNKPKKTEQELYESFRWLNIPNYVLNTITEGELWDNLCEIKRMKEEFEDYLDGKGDYIHEKHM